MMKIRLLCLVFFLFSCPVVRADAGLKPVPINPGEAVIAAFLEESFYDPRNWEILDGSSHGLTMQREYRMFHGAMFQWLKRPAGNLGFSMSKSADLDVSGFDNLIVGAVIPEGARLEILLKTENGQITRTFDKLPGQQREYILPLDGTKHIREIKLNVYSEQEGLQAGAILWIIVQNEAKLTDYLASLLPYGTEWMHHLKPEDYQPEFVPEYGIVFGKDQLDDIRGRHEKIMQTEGVPSYLESARQAMKSVPEELIKESVGNGMRFARDRDLEVLDLKPSELAIAGILTRDKAMLRMAARYAMTLAVTPYWDEGFMGHFPGSNWVHAAFRESWAAHELAITLDLAGEMFTEAGKKFILKRLAVDGIGHINYITWSAEYIHRMNQMSVFSHGRLLAYAVLEKTMPRVSPYLDLAYSDLVNSLQTIFLPDGGNVEGPSYMTYTIGEAGLALYYYAMARNKPLSEVIPANIRNTSAFAEALCSTVPAYDMIPVCDADPRIDQIDALSFLASVSGDSRWIDIYEKVRNRKKNTTAGRNAGTVPAGILSLVIPEEKSHTSPPIPSFVSLPDMGILASTRKIDGEWLKILIQGNKAKAGHTHEDKGSFVIEFAGDLFAGDFGRAPYGDPMTFLTKQCQWHNMLIPVADGERPAPANPIVVDVKPDGTGNTENFEAFIDITPGWENYYSKNTRRWDSPVPDQLVMTDEYELVDGKAVEFYWQTMLPAKRKGNTVTIEGKKGIAEIRIPHGTTCRIETHSWWNGTPVNRIIFTKSGTSGKIETRVTFKIK